MGATRSEQYSDKIKLTAAVNTALSHPARLTIIQTLKTQPGLRPKDLMAVVELSHTATSEHLRRLRHAGIIEFKYVLHNYQVFLVQEKLKPVLDFLNEVSS